MKVTLTGATGFVGRHAAERLRAEGHAVRPLSRPEWDAIQGPPPLEALREADAVIHLAGEPVAQRWNEEVKRRVFASRIDGTRNLVEALGRLERRPTVLISASGIGYYGSRGDEVLTEASAAGADVLAELAVEWERAANAAAELGIRVVTLRIGIVLGRDGGALKKMLTPFRMGVGGRLGSGKQWMSWIHIEDVAGLIVFALEKADLRGAVNATAPNPVTNAEFTRALAKALHRPAIFPVPEPALKALFGEMAGPILSSQRVLPEAAEKAGYRFRSPELKGALEDLL